MARRREWRDVPAIQEERALAAADISLAWTRDVPAIQEERALAAADISLAWKGARVQVRREPLARQPAGL